MWLSKYSLIYCVSVVLTGCDAQVNPIVQISNGLVQGKQGFTIGQHIPYYSFRGIPFAQPPVGDLRFEPPLAASNWDGVFDATNDKDACVQGSDPVIGSEDCLYINVYTPVLPSNSCELLPVFFWIYGGGFIGGNSSYQTFGPDYLLEKGIIIVDFNYRLGIFGFLSTGDSVAPGNAGLKDQVLALQWTKNNIQHFCGDPNKITIAGQSAGAASVGYHLLSPLSQGLFQQAMLSSGTALNLWALSRITPQTVSAVALSLGVDISSSQSTVDGLKNVNVTSLQNQATTIFNLFLLIHNPLLGFPLGPVREPDLPGAFFTGKSWKQLVNGQFIQVNTLMGYNSAEGSAQFMLPVRLYILAKIDTDYRLLLPVMNTPLLIQTLPAKSVKFNYFGLLPIALNDDDSLTWFIGDDLFERPIRKYAQLLEANSNISVYFYRFSYEGGLWGFNGTDRPFPGVTHAEELSYYWVSPYQPISPQDIVVRTRMVTLITNFVKYGTPTPTIDPTLQNITWPTFGNELNYVDIGNNLVPSQNPNSVNMTFWDNLYDIYGVPPYDTY